MANQNFNNNPDLISKSFSLNYFIELIFLLIGILFNLIFMVANSDLKLFQIRFSDFKSAFNADFYFLSSSLE